MDAPETKTPEQLRAMSTDELHAYIEQRKAASRQPESIKETVAGITPRNGRIRGGA